MSAKPPIDSSRTLIPAGTQLNSVYEIDAPIATGGMGEVYRGHSIQTGDPVAIKLIRSDLNQEEAAFALFRKEAAALHNLFHEAIVRYYIFTIDPVLERPYLAMEFVDGQSLSAILRKAPLPCEAVHRLMVRVASGLHAAHMQHIVHRDISPDNIIIPVGEMKKAKIIDFGIARSTRLDGGDGTIIGTGFAGKYNYVSPEQLGLFGGEVTPKSDIYSLALVLAEALRQKPIDMGGNHATVVEKRRKVPDLSGVDARMRPLLERMLQPNPKDRPASMAEIAAWKLPAIKLRTPPPRPPSPRGGGRKDEGPFTLPLSLPIIGMIVALVIGGAFGGYMWLFPPKPPSDGSDKIADQSEEEKAKKIIDGLWLFVTQYGRGDSCFFVKPLKITDKAAYLEGYGVTSGPFSRLDGEFRQKAGFAATIGWHEVAPNQCSAVNLVHQLQNSQGNAPKINLAATALKLGQNLTGTVEGPDGQLVDLFLVADDGSVRHLVAGLNPPAGEKATFNAKLGPDIANGKLQLLVAIASPKPLAIFQNAATAAAAELFPRLAADARNASLTLAASLRSFKLDK
jgi:eukaryotic-like serine/threonine-protein kinase